jgi:hypothetical protein
MNNELLKLCAYKSTSPDVVGRLFEYMAIQRIKKNGLLLPQFKCERPILPDKITVVPGSSLVADSGKRLLGPKKLKLPRYRFLSQEQVMQDCVPSARF